MVIRESCLWLFKTEKTSCKRLDLVHVFPGLVSGGVYMLGVVGGFSLLCVEFVMLRRVNLFNTTRSFHYLSLLNILSK